jgi:hypothetical protein
MTDLKPSAVGGADNLGAPSEPHPPNINAATGIRPAQPTAAQTVPTKSRPARTNSAESIKPAQPSDAQTTAPTKPDPATGHRTSSDAPCTQSDCSGTIVDGYCDVCGSPAAATVELARPTNRPSLATPKPQPRANPTRQQATGPLPMRLAPNLTASAPSSTATATSAAARPRRPLSQPRRRNRPSQATPRPRSRLQPARQVHRLLREEG